MPTAQAVLYILSGLPGTGKSTLGKLLAARKKAAYLRIDTVEQGLRELCGVTVGGEGYRLSYRIALDNLRLGRSVVADSCNLLEFTRREWEEVADIAGAEFVNIEIVCSDNQEHRKRIATRKPEVPGLILPSWRDVQEREREPWSCEHLVIDTAGRSPQTCLRKLLKKLKEPSAQENR